MTGEPVRFEPPVETWAVVLAAGQGQRLARLVRALHGHDVPKQFAALDGEQTFLQQTLARAGRLTPPERTVVVVSAEHVELARHQLAAFPGVRVVAQPRNAGTLPGLLLPLAHVLDASPRARVIVYPSDHHVRRVGPFADAVASALAAVDRTPARLVLVGARADRPATDLGWIVPGATLEDAAAGAASPPARFVVQRFVEKPAARLAARLFEAGAMWNTLLLAFDGPAFWQSALSARPELAQAFGRYRSAIGSDHETTLRHEIYDGLPALDLSRDLLATRRGLGVVEMRDAGWSDCGTPERLLECLEGSGGLERFLGRLATGFRVQPSG